MNKCNPGVKPGHNDKKGKEPGAMPGQKAGTAQKHVGGLGNWNGASGTKKPG